MKSYDLRQPQKSLVVLSIICIRINQIFKQTFSRFFRTNTLQNRNRTSRVIKTAPSEDSQSSWNKCMNPRFYISLWKYTWILENCPRLVNNISKRKEKRGNTIISTLSFYLTSSFEDFFLSLNSQGEIYINIKGQPCQKVFLIDIEAYTISLYFFMKRTI